MIDKAIIVFDDAGNGSYAIDWPWTAETIVMLNDQGSRYAILDRGFPDTYWMDENGDCYLREPITIGLDKTRILADGVDEATITGLPEECCVMVGDQRYDVDDGELILSTPQAGELLIRLGEDCKSNSLVLQAVDLGQHRDAKKAEINATRTDAMAASPTSFGVFDSNAEAKQNISGIVTGITAVGAANHPNIPFRMADNSLHTFTPAEFVQASLEVSSHISNVYARSWALKEHIDTLVDLDAIDAVTWETQLD